MDSVNEPALPLAGVRVLDFSHGAAGPVAAMSLGDLGAEVIKIEKPGQGDAVRVNGTPLHGRTFSDYFAAFNRNKRSVVLDLSTPGGVDVARRIAAESDIALENFRPSVMERLGLGFDDLRKVRSHLVYGSITAFGPSGPWRDRPANDMIMQSVSGLMSVTGEADGGPVRVGGPVADIVSGYVLLSGVLAALRVRDAHPEGQHVQVAMLDVVLNLMANYIPGLAAGLYDRIPRQGSSHGRIVPYQAFECSDDEFLMVGAISEAYWVKLCAAVGRPDLAADQRLATNADRVRNSELVIPQLKEIFRSKSREQWSRILDHAGMAFSPVYPLHEAIVSPQARHNRVLRQMRDDDGRAVTAVRSPISNDAWPPLRMDFPPALGRDSRDVLRILLAMSDAEIAALTDAGAVSLGEEADQI